MNASTSEAKNNSSKHLYSDSELRDVMELLFFSYRDFLREPDTILAHYKFGRAHHRVIHFVERNTNITVNDLLSILQITKQSLSRVLGQLVSEVFIKQQQGKSDRRQRLLSLTQKGRALGKELSQHQRDRIAKAFLLAGPDAVNAFYKVLINMMNDPKEFERSKKA